MKEYSEAKTCKNKSELRNGEANTDFFYSSVEIIIIIIASRTEFIWEFVYNKTRKCENKRY